MVKHEFPGEIHPGFSMKFAENYGEKWMVVLSLKTLNCQNNPYPSSA